MLLINSLPILCVLSASSGCQLLKFRRPKHPFVLFGGFIGSLGYGEVEREIFWFSESEDNHRAALTTSFSEVHPKMIFSLGKNRLPSGYTSTLEKQDYFLSRVCG